MIEADRVPNFVDECSPAAIPARSEANLLSPSLTPAKGRTGPWRSAPNEFDEVALCGAGDKVNGCFLFPVSDRTQDIRPPGCRNIGIDHERDDAPGPPMAINDNGLRREVLVEQIAPVVHLTENNVALHDGVFTHDFVDDFLRGVRARQNDLHLAEVGGDDGLRLARLQRRRVTREQEKRGDGGNDTFSRRVHKNPFCMSCRSAPTLVDVVVVQGDRIRMFVPRVRVVFIPFSLQRLVPRLSLFALRN